MTSVDVIDVIFDPHQNLHSYVSHPVDSGPYLLWKSPPRFLLPIIFCNFAAEKQQDKSEEKIATKTRFLQLSKQLLETCLCCASLFCIAPARLDHVAPWLQFISLSKKDFGHLKNRGKIGTAACFHQGLHFTAYAPSRVCYPCDSTTQPQSPPANPTDPPTQAPPKS